MASRKERRAAASVDRKRGVAYEKIMNGALDGIPETLRYSTALAALRRAGNQEAVSLFIADKEKYGSRCPNHGELKDPVVVRADIEGERVAFGCPWCSGADILAAWEKEGLRS